MDNSDKLAYTCDICGRIFTLEESARRCRERGRFTKEIPIGTILEVCKLGDDSKEMGGIVIGILAMHKRRHDAKLTFRQTSDFPDFGLHIDSIGGTFPVDKLDQDQTIVLDSDCSIIQRA